MPTISHNNNFSSFGYEQSRYVECTFIPKYPVLFKYTLMTAILISCENLRQIRFYDTRYPICENCWTLVEIFVPGQQFHNSETVSTTSFQ